MVPVSLQTCWPVLQLWVPRWHGFAAGAAHLVRPAARAVQPLATQISADRPAGRAGSRPGVTREPRGITGDSRRARAACAGVAVEVRAARGAVAQRLPAVLAHLGARRTIGETAVARI